MSARDQGSRPSTIWTPRDHNLMAKDVDEPHGTARRGSQASQLRAAAPAPMATVAGSVILGTRSFCRRHLASCSAKIALITAADANTRCVVISAPDHRRRRVMQRRMNGRSRPPASAALTKRFTTLARSGRSVLATHPHAEGILVKHRPEPVREPCRAEVMRRRQRPIQPTPRLG